MSEIRMPSKEDIEGAEERQVTTRKPGFMENELHEVKSFIFSDVVIPMAKEMLYSVVSGLFDMASSAAEAKIFGEATPITTRRHGRSGHVDYSSLSVKRTSRRMDRMDTSTAYKTVIFKNRYDADNKREEIYQILEDEGYVTVGDVNHVFGLPSEYTDEDWGWKSLAGTRIKTARHGGYTIEFPRPKALGR